MQRSSTGVKIAAQRFGAWGKTAGLGGGIGRRERRKIEDMCRSVLAARGVRLGFDGEVMLHFESDS